MNKSLKLMGGHLALPKYNWEGEGGERRGGERGWLKLTRSAEGEGGPPSGRVDDLGDCFFL